MKLYLMSRYCTLDDILKEKECRPKVALSCFKASVAKVSEREAGQSWHRNNEKTKTPKRFWNIM